MNPLETAIAQAAINAFWPCITAAQTSINNDASGANIAAQGVALEGCLLAAVPSFASAVAKILVNEIPSTPPTA